MDTYELYIAHMSAFFFFLLDGTFCSWFCHFSLFGFSSLVGSSTSISTSTDNSQSCSCSSSACSCSIEQTPRPQWRYRFCARRYCLLPKFSQSRKSRQTKTLSQFSEIGQWTQTCPQRSQSFERTCGICQPNVVSRWHVASTNYITRCPTTERNHGQVARGD